MRIEEVVEVPIQERESRIRQRYGQYLGRLTRRTGHDVPLNPDVRHSELGGRTVRVEHKYIIKAVIVGVVIVD
jgi:hypothetical protein